MKHVHPTVRIAHLWAHQTQSDARNPQRNLFFAGASLYSYRHGWTVAKIYTKGKGKAAKTLVLVNSQTYSVTTAKHTSLALRSVRHLDSVTVPYADIGEGDSTNQTFKTDNLTYLLKGIDRAHAKAIKAQSLRMVEALQKQAEDIYVQAERYNRFFKIVKKLKPMPSFEAAIARRTQLDQPDPLKDAKAYKAKQYREASKAKRAERAEAEEFVSMSNCWNNVKEWANHKGPLPDYRYRWPMVPTVLRVSKEGNAIETSEGASVPLVHARLLYAKILKIKASGTEYKRNGHTIHVGHYPLDRIDIEGNIRVGCHSITFDTIESLACQLGWIDSVIVNESLSLEDEQREGIEQGIAETTV